jgi:hypothetical protein
MAWEDGPLIWISGSESVRLMPLARKEKVALPVPMMEAVFVAGSNQDSVGPKSISQGRLVPGLSRRLRCYPAGPDREAWPIRMRWLH